MFFNNLAIIIMMIIGGMGSLAIGIANSFSATINNNSSVELKSSNGFIKHNNFQPSSSIRVKSFTHPADLYSDQKSKWFNHLGHQIDLQTDYFPKEKGAHPVMFWPNTLSLQVAKIDNTLSLGWQNIKWLENFSKTLDDPFSPKDLMKYININDHPRSQLGVVHSLVKEKWALESFLWVRSYPHYIPKGKDSAWFEMRVLPNQFINVGDINKENLGNSFSDRYGVGSKLRITIPVQTRGHHFPIDLNIYAARVLDPFFYLAENDFYTRNYAHQNLFGTYASWSVNEELILRIDGMITVNKKINYLQANQANKTGPTIQVAEKNLYSIALGMDYFFNTFISEHLFNNLTLSGSLLINKVINYDQNFFIPKQNYLGTISIKSEFLPALGLELLLSYARYLRWLNGSNGGYLSGELSRTFFNALKASLEADFFYSGGEENGNDLFSYAKYRQQIWAHVLYSF